MAEAIIHCCLWSSYRASFGEFGVNGPLICYLKSKDHSVLLSPTIALYHLFRVPINIIIMQKEEVVQVSWTLFMAEYVCPHQVLIDQFLSLFHNLETNLAITSLKKINVIWSPTTLL